MFVSRLERAVPEYANSNVLDRGGQRLIGPKVRRYLGRSTIASARAGFGGSFLIVQSTGGLTKPSRPNRTAPHAGIRARGRRHRHQGAVRALGLDNAIAFDMGGTTAKAGVITPGEPLTTGAALIGRL